MKKILLLLILCALIGCQDFNFGTNEETSKPATQTLVPSQGLNFEYLEDGTYSVSLGRCKDLDVVIPSSYNGIPVSCIADFQYAAITSVIICEWITTINDYAFNNCSNLMSITLPTTLEKIYPNAFENCSRLIEVRNKSKLDITCGSLENGKIGLYAKNIYTKLGDSKLEKTEDGFTLYRDKTEVILLHSLNFEANIVIPKDVTYIYPYTFERSSNIQTVELNDKLKCIGEYAFSRNENLHQINFPSSLVEIQDYAFYGCNKLLTITLPENLRTIGDGAFYGCYKLVQIINLSNLELELGSKNYGNVAYFARIILDDEKDSCLTTTNDGYVILKTATATTVVSYLGNEYQLNLPEGITEIARYAFILENIDHNLIVKVPEGTKRIEEDAFIMVRSIELPSTIEYIDEEAFNMSFGFIYYHGSEESWNAIGYSINENTGNYLYPYFYSETQPEEANKFWYYNDNGAPTIWE